MGRDGFGLEGADAPVIGALITPKVDAGRALGRDLARLAPKPAAPRPVDIRAPLA